MSRTDFFQEFERIFRMGLHSGAENVPLRGNTAVTAFSDESHRKQFIRACHRGYEKAQTRIVELCIEIAESHIILDEEKDWRQLMLRKIMDGIVTLLFRGESHVLRRLGFHSRPPKIALDVIRQALSSANTLNSESRLTFALVADLTTLVHICDIVRIDFRTNPPRVSMIELKSGRVNEMLMSQLETYEPTEESITRIAENPLVIEPKYQAQAQRILRQKLRLRQVDQVLKTDAGIDIKTKHPIKLSKEEVHSSSYDKLLNDLMNCAREKKLAAGMVNYCIHIGVGFSDDPAIGARRAFNALCLGIQTHFAKPPDGLSDILNEVNALIPDGERFKASTLLSNNLIAMNSWPFTLWQIDMENLMSFAKAQLAVVSAFDVASFIWLARSCGLNMRLSTRKEASKQTQELGAATIPTWGNRALCWDRGEMRLYVSSGLISRFINDLSNPLPFLEYDAREAQVKTP